MTDTRVSLPPSMSVFERGWLSSNNILFVDEGQAALVDSGYMSHAEQTLALVRHALGSRKLDLLINTHLHSDHCGGNAILQREYACRTLVPVADAEAVAAWDEEQLTYKATGQQCGRFTADGALSPGERLQLGGLEWQVLAAPGHDPHSLILYCTSEAILISADALWENGFGVIFPELEDASGFAEQAEVLQLIAGLDVRVVIPGHGAPFSNVAAALDRAHGRLDYLAADPRRNARNALKVMMAFLLLEKRELSLHGLQGLVRQNRIMWAAAQKLDAPVAMLIATLAAELVQAGAATLDGDRLLNAR
ncbi:MBL fold metallo-hydrolase [Undibacterium sp. TJN25]|uniref:MBL fold metallo-hydrolase n=1 Tax=Undibacterium sp. TJN25 TaxID=3413056 RepID=UPI003BF212D2